MYEIATRHNIFELKTHSILMIYRTLSTVERADYLEDEVINLIRPIYSLYLPTGDRLIAFLLQRVKRGRDYSNSPCAAGLHVAIYEIAIRHNIFELKTHSILMIHRTLSAVEREGHPEEEVINLIKPIYNLYLPAGDRMVEHLRQRIRRMGRDFSNGPCAAGLHVAMYEIATRHNIFELKTHSILMTHRTLSAAESWKIQSQHLDQICRWLSMLHIKE